SSCEQATVGIRTIMLVLLIASVAVSGVLGQSSFQCPADGFYSDSAQCDKYYDCYNGQVTEKLCSDGLVFDYRQDASLERCEFPFLVPCDGLLQPAQPTGVCYRQNGLFEHEDPANCNQYYECTSGNPVKRDCFIGGVFDPLSGQCLWEASGARTGCGVVRETINGFQCPLEAQHNLEGRPDNVHKVYADLDDCRYFYTCHNGVKPVRNGCPIGTVFNDRTYICDAPENVPECATYYQI
ncbi:unnamed protein product, partial [Meganyctiphanes norvegica]